MTTSTATTAPAMERCGARSLRFARLSSGGACGALGVVPSTSTILSIGVRGRDAGAEQTTASSAQRVRGRTTSHSGQQQEPDVAGDLQGYFAVASAS